VAAVAGGSAPAVSADEALEALRLATRIRAALEVPDVAKRTP